MNRAVLVTIAWLTAQGAIASCDVDIHVNQIGFLTQGPKRAIVATAATEPVPWSLIDSNGDEVTKGRTNIFGDDAMSGLTVHLADFSEYRTGGQGYRIRAACGRSHPFAISAEVYDRLAYDALAYFYHNRSHVPIEPEYAGGDTWARPAGHPTDAATCREDTDQHGNRWPGCDYTLDATGGWYDAGDHGKYVVNGGIAVWTLMNYYERSRLIGVDAFADGSAALPEAGNGINDLLDEARIEMQFLLSMQAPQGAGATVPVGIPSNGPEIDFTRIDASGMAHHKIADREWTSLPTSPHEAPRDRVLYPVSTAATLNLAATAAQCARIWKSIDEEFSKRCLQAARRAFDGARRNPDVHFIADFSGSGMYGDDQFSDEFFWAAAELYITTSAPEYYEALRSSPHYEAPITTEPAWPQVAPLGVVSLAVVPNAMKAEEVAGMRERIIDAATRFSEERAEVGYHIPYASKQYHWGSNSNVLNRAMLLAYAHDFTGNETYRNAVIDAMDYILGRNPMDTSYVSGYGERAMENPHHRFWAHSLDPDFPPPPPGALSGGPNSSSPADSVARTIHGDCTPQTCWRDHIDAYSLNEVAINWNAPLVWVSAYLAEPGEPDALRVQ